MQAWIGGRKIRKRAKCQILDSSTGRRLLLSTGLTVNSGADKHRVINDKKQRERGDPQHLGASDPDRVAAFRQQRCQHSDSRASDQRHRPDAPHRLHARPVFDGRQQKSGDDRRSEAANHFERAPLKGRNTRTIGAATTPSHPLVMQHTPVERNRFGPHLIEAQHLAPVLFDESASVFLARKRS